MRDDDVPKEWRPELNAIDIQPDPASENIETISSYKSERAGELLLSSWHIEAFVLILPIYRMERGRESPLDPFPFLKDSALFLLLSQTGGGTGIENR